MGIVDEDNTTKIFLVALLDANLLIVDDPEPSEQNSTLHLRISISLKTSPRIYYHEDDPSNRKFGV